jgi:hypothetical protein
MAIDYSAALARVRAFLMDSSSLVWQDSDLQGAIRLSLGEISLLAGEGFFLSGLDSAVNTTLPANLEALLVVGAGGYAGVSRAADRSEAFELVGEFKDTKQWGEKRLAEFRSQLGKIYPGDHARTASQRSATAQPWASWTDDFGEKGSSDLFD